MGLLEDLEFLKKQRKPNLLANTRQLQGPAEPYLRQQYPEVYGALGGLLGMAPDEMAGSVLDPNTARVRAGAEYGFPVGTAAQVLPMAKPAQAAAMAAGRAGERLAGRVVPQIMERGGVGAEMLQGMSRNTLSPMDVYHGSPHKFDRFDASKIGTGEGNQAYGYGLYLAENPGVAETYQKMVNTGSISKQAKKFVRENIIAGADNDAILKAATSSKNQATRWDLEDVKRGIPASRNDYVNAMDEVQEFLTKNPISQTDGSLYKVDLPDAQIAKMLDWDKPLSEQPWVMSRVKPMLEDSNISLERIPLLTGKDLMSVDGPMAAWFGKNRTPSMFSEGLRQEGIPGIKYLDATSRGAGTGTRNFVTFPGEEQNLTILERNGQPMIARTQQQDAAPDLLQYQQMLDEEERKKLGGLLFR